MSRLPGKSSAPGTSSKVGLLGSLSPKFVRLLLEPATATATAQTQYGQQPGAQHSLPATLADIGAPSVLCCVVLCALCCVVLCAAFAAADDRQAQLQQQLSMSYRLATRLIKYYGADPDLALDQVTKNPYAHCYSMPGYTLDQAEETARALGFNPAAPERGAAYLQSELLDAHSDSKLSLAWSVLEKHTLQRLLNAPFRGWPADQGLRVAAEQLVQDGRVVVEEQQPLQTETAAGADKQQEHRHHRKQQQPEVFEFKQVSSQWLDDAHVYLQEVHQAEQDVVEYFVVGLEECCEQLERLQWQQRRQVAADQQQQQELTAGGTQRGHRQSGKQGAAAAAEALQTASASSSSSSLQLPLTVSAAHADLIDELQQELSQQLGKSVVFNEGQRVALVLAQLLPMVFLSGGPGCGKTLTSQAIVRRWLDESSADELELFMAAPTGRQCVVGMCVLGAHVHFVVAATGYEGVCCSRHRHCLVVVSILNLDLRAAVHTFAL